jgi:hypothetical protein
MTFETVARQLAEDGARLSTSTAEIVKSIDVVVSKLAALQTPEHVIEIKLNPAIEGLTRVVSTFSRNAEAQAISVNSNLKQTQALSSAITVLLSELRATEAARLAANLSIDPADAPPPAPFEADGKRRERDPEKHALGPRADQWGPVFREDHAQTTSMTPSDTDQ